MSTIVERIIEGEKWWVDSESGRTYGLCRVVTEDQARRKLVMRTARAAKSPALLKESDIETAIVQAMEKDGWRAFKMEENFSERKRKKTGEPGMCDHLFLRPHNQGDPRGPVPGYKTRCYNPLGDILWWEFKAAKEVRKRAEILSPKQVQWQMLTKAQGFLVWSAGVDHDATIAGAAQHYLESGLCRRREIFVALVPPEGRALPDRERRLGDGE